MGNAPVTDWVNGPIRSSFAARFSSEECSWAISCTSIGTLPFGLESHHASFALALEHVGGEELSCNWFAGGAVRWARKEDRDRPIFTGALVLSLCLYWYEVFRNNLIRIEAVASWYQSSQRCMLRVTSRIRLRYTSAGYSYN
jgi:hypothetical protein